MLDGLRLRAPLAPLLLFARRFCGSGSTVQPGEGVFTFRDDTSIVCPVWRSLMPFGTMPRSS